MMRSCCLPHSRGFTIVESLIAIAVLALVAMTLVPLVAQGFSEIHIAGYRIQSIHTAQRAVDIESLRSDATGSHTMTIEFTGAGDIHIPGEIFEEQVTVFANRKSSITIFIPSR